ncbi:adenosylcobinamide-GDP ribazoletransferase [Aestuariicella hydrocarbonica]|uniref:Adenosylcobinamide-GDP ribazoletransferase n=1 Tax=Pseudomaricurvus hydrocarbonicus TaxID=1470433 RepID=A0A9E5MLC6_9GAMM|nr:adenosylcobinamide-GDP ribazoletransferase [Aestuariicella hydrocarbonica]NHO64253.1 adenosylcobinamide-GDP ribazoletransferase [Aestuariicella hydrocarbonica]
MKALTSSPLGRALIVAFLFLTRLPMPRLPDYDPRDSGRALPLFPLVGLAIGGLLALTATALQGHLPASVVAALVVTLWVLITGGLHLDGLGDSADGWLAGGDTERTLEIMKDPRSGSAAVIIIGCLLLLKFSALSALIAHQNGWALCLAPVLSRAMALLLLLSTPYVSKQGIAENFLKYANRRHLRISVACAWIFALVLLPLPQALILMVTVTSLFAGLRALMVRRLGGTTGDTSGASIEILEAAVLIACLVSV